MTQQLLRMGAGGLNENEIAQRMADVGAQLGGRFDFDRAGVSLRTLSSKREREAALDVLARILQQPEFPQQAFERERTRTIAGIQEADTKPDVMAGRAFNRALFSDHPYGIRASGEVETLKSLSHADLGSFYRTHYAAERAIVAIIGDLSRAEAEQIARRLTDGLPRTQGKPPEVPAVRKLERAIFTRLDHPASQSHILVGAPGIHRTHPDFFPLFVGNHVLGGGGFSSRLTDEVRQKRGLAYSVYSYFAPLVREGPFQIGLQTQGDQALGALEVVMGTLKSFLADGPTEKELAEAKDNIIGGFPMRIDSNRKIHDHLATIGFYDLPLTYLDDFVKNVEKVTVADVRAAFARNLSAERLATVIVGGGNPTENR
jgi:zinc protease